MNKNGIYNLNVLVFKSKHKFNYMILHLQEIYLRFLNVIFGLNI